MLRVSLGFGSLRGSSAIAGINVFFANLLDLIYFDNIPVSSVFRRTLNLDCTSPSSSSKKWTLLEPESLLGEASCELVLGDLGVISGKTIRGFTDKFSRLFAVSLLTTDGVSNLGDLFGFTIAFTDLLLPGDSWPDGEEAALVTGVGVRWGVEDNWFCKTEMSFVTSLLERLDFTISFQLTLLLSDDLDTVSVSCSSITAPLFLRRVPFNGGKAEFRYSSSSEKAVSDLYTCFLPSTLSMYFLYFFIKLDCKWEISSIVFCLSKFSPDTCCWALFFWCIFWMYVFLQWDVFPNRMSLWWTWDPMLDGDWTFHHSILKPTCCWRISVLRYYCTLHNYGVQVID